MNYRVDFLPEDRGNAGRYDSALREYGIEVHCLRDRHPAHWLSENYQNYAAIVLSRYHLAMYWLPFIRSLSSDLRIVLDTIDLHYIRELREAELRGNLALARAALRTQTKELQQVRKSDVTWVVSHNEKSLLETVCPGTCIEVVSNLHDPVADIPGYGPRRDLLFIGGGRHPPNVDAARWLLAEIFPLIRQRLPDCELHLVGPGLNEALSGRALPSGVHMHGHVPDLNPLLGRCRVGLAPLRFGAGVKGKINQYMAHGIPTVSTSCAAEGMHLEDGKDVLLADRPEAFADCIARVYGKEDLWRTLSTNGLNNIHKYFSSDAMLPALNRTFQGLPPTR